MAHTYADIMAQKGRGFAPGSLTPDQSKVAYQIRQHPDYTLHEAKVEAGITEEHYTKKELARMAAEVPWEDLRPSQKKLIAKVPDEKVTPAMIAFYTGISEREILKALNMKRYHGIDPNSLVYKASRGFYGKTNITGKTVILFGREGGAEGEYITFDQPKEIEKVIREKVPCPTPPCAEEEVVKTFIPLKNGAERNNISSEKDIAA